MDQDWETKEMMDAGTKVWAEMPPSYSLEERIKDYGVM